MNLLGSQIKGSAVPSYKFSLYSISIGAKQKRQSYKCNRNVNRRCKRKQCLEENLILVCNVLSDHRIAEPAYAACGEHCQYPSFSIITIDMLINIYLMVHVYASPPLQKYYKNSRFIFLYLVTFNQATYPFNSNGKM